MRFMPTALFFLGLTLASCMTAADFEKSEKARMSSIIGCPPSAIAVHVSSSPGYHYDVVGCDRVFRCVTKEEKVGNYYRHDRQCDETEESKMAIVSKVVVDRLSLDTGCPKDGIKIESQSEWTQGTEKAFRMSACSKWYVCTTSAGHTDCKPAENPK